MAQVEAPVSNGHATLNGTAPKKIKNKAALKRAKQKEKRKNVSRQTSVVRSMKWIDSGLVLTIKNIS